MAKEFVTSSSMVGSTNIVVYEPRKRVLFDSTSKMTSIKMVADKFEHQIDSHGFTKTEVEDIKAYCSFLHLWCEIHPNTIKIIKYGFIGYLKKLDNKWMFKLDIFKAKNIKRVIAKGIKEIKKDKIPSVNIFSPVLTTKNISMKLNRNGNDVVVDYP